MTSLSAEDIANLDRMVAEQASGVTPYSDETDCLIWAALPALIAMAKLSRQLSDELFEFRDGIDHPAEGCACRRDPRTGEWPHECLFHQRVRERAEKAEAECDRYREMAVRLPGIVQYRGIPQNGDLIAPHRWTAMAAFDSLTAAELYVERQTPKPWEYRAIDIAELMKEEAGK